MLWFKPAPVFVSSSSVKELVRLQAKDSALPSANEKAYMKQLQERISRPSGKPEPKLDIWPMLKEVI